MYVSDPFGAIGSCFRKYAVFEGRASRSEFWWFVLFQVVAGAMAELLLGEIGGLAASLLLFFPAMAVACRRLHDRDHSGWWQTLPLIVGLIGFSLFESRGIASVATVLTVIWLAIKYCHPSQPGTNRFGPSPFENNPCTAFFSQNQGSKRPFSRREAHDSPCHAPNMRDRDRQEEIMSDNEQLNFEKLLKAANDGDADAQLELANAGDAEAQYQLGYAYRYGEGVAQNYEQAVYWTRKAAAQGFAMAQFGLGVMYEQGEGVAQDKSQAAKWYRKAAEQGDASAQFNLGVSYEYGTGVMQDHETAVYWYRKAAEQGHAKAQFNLGMFYHQGKGVAQDDNQAVKWYRKAAEQGLAEAQNNLGYMYAQGKGVAQDWKQAVHWYGKAAAQGLIEAQRILDILQKK